MGDVGTPTGLVVRSGWDERAYMGDVGTPTGLVVRSGGGERAYMGDVGTPAGCIKNLQHCMIFLHFTPPL